MRNRSPYCSICGVLKDKGNTYCKISNVDKLDTYCKKCKNSLCKKRWNSRTPEQREKDLQYRINYNKTYKRKEKKPNSLTPEAIMFRNLRGRCLRANIPFNLTEEDIIIPNKCPLLNIPMEFKTMTAPSVDRIVPELGYVKGNIIIISRKANLMKNNASLKELMTFCKNAANVYSSFLSDDQSILSWPSQPQ